VSGPADRPVLDRPPDPGPVDAATVRSAVLLLREPFWARLGVAVVLLAVAFFFLGRWQLGRHEAKVARNDVVEANYSGTPVALDAVLATPASALPADRQWTRVRLQGRYEPGGQTLIRNRPLDGNFGFEVVVPLRLASGAAVLVDRGWVPAGEKVVEPDAVPAPPQGPVTVVVRVRPGEPPLERTPPPGQELRLDLGRLALRAGGTVYRGAYGVLATEQPAPAVAPAPLPEPDLDLGPHLAYAVQWWIGDVAAFGLLGYYALKEARTRAGGGAGGPGAGGSPGDPGSPSGGKPRKPSKPDRPRRRDLSDEEWEDAATG